MNGHQVEVFDLSVPHEHAAFAKQTCQPDMLLYVSSKFMDVYREDDKRFRCELMCHFYSGSNSSWDEFLKFPFCSYLQSLF